MNEVFQRKQSKVGNAPQAIVLRTRKTKTATIKFNFWNPLETNVIELTVVVKAQTETKLKNLITELVLPATEEGISRIRQSNSWQRRKQTTEYCQACFKGSQWQISGANATTGPRIYGKRTSPWASRPRICSQSSHQRASGLSLLWWTTQVFLSMYSFAFSLMR